MINHLVTPKEVIQLSDSIITPNDLAREMGVSPKNLRAHMRRMGASAGSGARYALTADYVAEIKRTYRTGTRTVVTPLVSDIKRAKGTK